jgi:hypothetical protein
VKEESSERWQAKAFLGIALKGSGSYSRRERCKWGEGPEAKFINSDWGDTVDSVMGLPYRPASLCSLTGQ